MHFCYCKILISLISQSNTPHRELETRHFLQQPRKLLWNRDPGSVPHHHYRHVWPLQDWGSRKCITAVIKSASSRFTFGFIPPIGFGFLFRGYIYTGRLEQSRDGPVSRCKWELYSDERSLFSKEKCWPLLGDIVTRPRIELKDRQSEYAWASRLGLGVSRNERQFWKWFSNGHVISV